MARTVLEFPGEDITIGGDFDVFGTTTGGEEITILTGSDVFLDPSFNTGGDTVRVPGEAEEYTIRTQGSYVILESTINDVRVEIPVGPAGITVVFGGDDTRTLNYDTTDGRVEIGGAPVDSSADPLTPGTDSPPAGQIFNLKPGSETIIGTEGDDRFRAANNELGAGDLIMGMGGTDKLEVFIDEAGAGFSDINYGGFELDSVEQVLVTNDSGQDISLDLSGAQGVELVGVVNGGSDHQGVIFNYLASLADILIKDNTSNYHGELEVYYQPALVSGTDDAVTLTIEDSIGFGDVTIGTIDSSASTDNTGIEILNIIVDGDSSIDYLDTELRDLTVSGAGDFEIEDTLLDTVRTIDATGLAGDFTVDYSNNTVGVTYDGTDQDDDVTIGSGLENISTNDGDDIVRAGSNFAGDDSAATGRQDDTIAFDAGYDTLTVDAGTLDVDYTNVSGLELLQLTSAGATVLGVQARESGIQRVEGTSGNDTITATAFNGDLTVAPGDGSDTVSTGSGDDTFEFRGDNQLDDSDTLDGNAGLDTIDVTGDFHLDSPNYQGIDVVTINSDGSTTDGNPSQYYFHDLNANNADETGTLVINGGGLLSDEYVHFDTTAAFSIDITTGAADDDFWILGTEDDIVDSGAGDDNVNTYGGDDDIESGSGDDFVDGGDGDDDIHLGSGDDTGNGGLGADRLYGDTGVDTLNLGVDTDSDTVLYASVADSGVTEGRDTINEFVTGDDVIDISELLASNGVDAANTEFISEQDLDAAEAQMISGDGVISIVFIEDLPGDPTTAIDDANGFFFVDINDDGELGGEDLQVFVNGDNVNAGDVAVALDGSGNSGFDIFMDEAFNGVSSMAALKMADASFA